MRLTLPTTALLLLSFSSLLSHAQIETDRPDFTESPNVVPSGALQIETGFVYEKDKEQHCGWFDDTRSNKTLNTTLIRYGITEKLELRLNWNIASNNTIRSRTPFGLGAPCSLEKLLILDSNYIEKGLEPIFVGFKTNLYKTDRLSLGFLGHIYLPFGASKDFEIKHYTPQFLIPFSVNLTDKLGMAMQWAMTWDGETGRSETGYTFSLSYGISDKLSAYVEPYGFIVENDGEDHRINGGFTYLINDNFQADLTGGRGLSSHAPDGFISCGLSFLFDKKP